MQTPDDTLPGSAAPHDPQLLWLDDNGTDDIKPVWLNDAPHGAGIAPLLQPPFSQTALTHTSLHQTPLPQTLHAPAAPAALPPRPAFKKPPLFVTSLVATALFLVSVDMVVFVLLPAYRRSLPASAYMPPGFKPVRRPQPTASPLPPVVTQYEANQIQFGFSYQQVAAVIGNPGSRRRDIYREGKRGIVYVWENHNKYSYFSTLFVADRLTEKYQQDLP